MKTSMNINKRLTTLLVLMFSLVFTIAQEVTVSGLKYYLFPDTHEAAINNGNTWSGELNIPSEVNYDGKIYTVTGITWAAFEDCDGLTKVKLPKTIKKVINHVLSDDPSIGGAVSPDNMNPFVRCLSLESIEVDEENQDFNAVDGVLFSKDGTRLYSYPSGAKAQLYTIPEGVTWIGSSAFEANKHLTSIVLPETIGKLCGSVFYACSSLKVIDIPQNISTIGSYAFGCCNPDALVIRGILDYLDSYLFDELNESTKIYVPSTELNRYKNKYNRSFFPLEDYFTGIKPSTSLFNNASTAYDFSGRTYHRSYGKGLYIQNGRKVVAR